MKRNEVNKIFADNFDKITVSEELKEKTLNRIKSSSTKKRAPYWLANCAAVLVVSCVCLGLYLSTQSNLRYSKSDSQNEVSPLLNARSITTEESINLDESKIEKMSIMKQSSKFIQLDSAPMEDSNIIFPASLGENITEDTTNSIQGMMPMTFTLPTSTWKIQIGDSLEDFLNAYPDAEKNADGYTIIDNSETFLYKIKDSKVSEIIKL